MFRELIHRAFAAIVTAPRVRREGPARNRKRVQLYQELVVGSKWRGVKRGGRWDSGCHLSAPHPCSPLSARSAARRPLRPTFAGRGFPGLPFPKKHSPRMVRDDTQLPSTAHPNPWKPRTTHGTAPCWPRNRSPVCSQDQPWHGRGLNHNSGLIPATASGPPDDAGWKDIDGCADCDGYAKEDRKSESPGDYFSFCRSKSTRCDG